MLLMIDELGTLEVQVKRGMKGRARDGASPVVVEILAAADKAATLRGLAAFHG